MSISVSCQECATAYRVPDTVAGKAIKCKKCGATMHAPGARNGGASPTNGGGGGAKPAKGGGAGKVLLIVGGILAVSCLLCTGVAGIGSWWVYSKTSKAVDDAQKDLGLFKDLKDGGKIPGPAGGNVLMTQQANLSPKDPQTQGKPYKGYSVKLEQGKTYVIEMKSAEIDSYLRLLDPANQVVAQDDDSGGFPNARIQYTAKQAGQYQVQASHAIFLPPNGGNFTLTVQEK